MILVFPLSSLNLAIYYDDFPREWMIMSRRKFAVCAALLLPVTVFLFPFYLVLFIIYYPISCIQEKIWLKRNE